MAGQVRLEIDGPIAVITNDNPDKHNAFDDEMDVQLFGILGELRNRPDVRVAVWRGEGKSFSSGRDVSAIGVQTVELTHHELMTRGHRGIQQLFSLDVPVIAALHGWVIGGSFQRALLCDIRIAAIGTRFMLPEVTHGVIPDTGGVARLFQICGPGVASDLVLTGRVMDGEEACGHGIVSRLVPAAALDKTAREMAEKIAEAPKLTVKLAREIIGGLANREVVDSMSQESLAQTVINASHDLAEFKAARAEDRRPDYRGG